MLLPTAILAVTVALSNSFSVRRESDDERALEGLVRREKPGCSSGSLHWNTGDTQSEGGVTCTCEGNNRWSCDKRLPGLSCYTAGRRVRDGESYKEGPVTCTCSDGQLDCPGLDDVTCTMGKRRFHEGQAYSEGGLTCTCTGGEWKCPGYN